MATIYNGIGIDSDGVLPMQKAIRAYQAAVNSAFDNYIKLCQDKAVLDTAIKGKDALMHYNTSITNMKDSFSKLVAKLNQFDEELKRINSDYANKSGTYAKNAFIGKVSTNPPVIK